MPARRNYHHHIVDIMDRLSAGIRQKGGRIPVDIADIAQVGPAYAPAEDSDEASRTLA